MLHVQTMEASVPFTITDIGDTVAVVGTQGWRCCICGATFPRYFSIEHHMTTGHQPVLPSSQPQEKDFASVHHQNTSALLSSSFITSDLETRSVVESNNQQSLKRSAIVSGFQVLEKNMSGLGHLKIKQEQNDISEQSVLDCATYNDISEGKDSLNRGLTIKTACDGVRENDIGTVTPQTETRTEPFKPQLSANTREPTTCVEIRGGISTLADNHLQSPVYPPEEMEGIEARFDSMHVTGVTPGTIAVAGELVSKFNDWSQLKSSNCIESNSETHTLCEEAKGFLSSSDYDYQHKILIGSLTLHTPQQSEHKQNSEVTSKPHDTNISPTEPSSLQDTKLPWECPKCKKNFAYKHIFRNHLQQCGIMESHKNHNSFHCMVCGNVFRNLNRFYDHYLYHKVQSSPLATVAEERVCTVNTPSHNRPLDASSNVFEDRDPLDISNEKDFEGFSDIGANNVESHIFHESETKTELPNDHKKIINISGEELETDAIQEQLQPDPSSVYSHRDRCCRKRGGAFCPSRQHVPNAWRGKGCKCIWKMFRRRWGRIWGLHGASRGVNFPHCNFPPPPLPFHPTDCSFSDSSNSSCHHSHPHHYHGIFHHGPPHYGDWFSHHRHHPYGDWHAEAESLHESDPLETANQGDPQTHVTTDEPPDLKVQDALNADRNMEQPTAGQKPFPDFSVSAENKAPELAVLGSAGVMPFPQPDHLNHLTKPSGTASDVKSSLPTLEERLLNAVGAKKARRVLEKMKEGVDGGHKKFRKKWIFKLMISNLQQGADSWMCPSCLEVFQEKDDLQSHFSSTHMEGDFVCFLCKEHITLPVAFNLHVRNHFQEWFTDGQHSSCMFRGRGRHLMMRLMHEKFAQQSSDCDNFVHHEMDTQNIDEDGNNNDRNEFKECPYCNKKFRANSRENYYERHVNFHLGIETFNYKCDDCGKTFLEKSKYESHIVTHDTPQLHSCETCGKGYKSKTSLTRHYRIHTGERPHRCEDCGEGFFEHRELMRHRSIHTGQAAFQCTVCNTGFTLKSSLLTHMRNKHTGDRRFICEICTKNFASSFALTRHRASCSGVQSEIVGQMNQITEDSQAGKSDHIIKEELLLAD